MLSTVQCPSDKRPDVAHEVRLVRTFTFEAAHRLPQAPVEHKCARLHGHSFRVDIVCEGKTDAQKGWLVDYGEIKVAFEPLMEQLDHQYLNEVPGLENPTAENIAVWIWHRLKPKLQFLAEVSIAETCNTSCVYRG
ncbi:MAG: 6-carboxytetrahydropterin synthase QueD [Planctomycetota bacterium]